MIKEVVVKSQAKEVVKEKSHNGQDHHCCWRNCWRNMCPGQPTR